MKQNQKKPPKLWITCLLLCMVICFDVIAIFTPDRKFSETENRMLAAFPSFSAQGLSDGSTGENVEKYLSDQFAFRDVWAGISFFTRSKLMGQNEMNGVYLGKDDYLMLVPSEPQPDSVQQKADAINAVTEKYGNINHCIAVIPNAVTVMTSKLPDYAPDANQTKQLTALSKKLKGISFCDVTKAMRSKRYEALFYHTDHHWTSLGAYTAFRSIAPSLGIDPDSVEFDVYTVSDSFQGTLASKSGSHGYYDTMEIYVPKGDHPLSVKYSDGDEAKGTLYQKEFLDTKDKYALFLGGNHPTVTVTTTADTNRTLMLIKDSYANCFVQFLTPYFDQIIIIDPRYCYDTVDMVLNEYEVTDLLYLYNADTFMSDTSLADFLTFSSPQENEE